MERESDEAARLWVEIRRRDLAIYEVAGRVGTHPTKLGRVLRGREPLTPDLAERIRGVLHQRGRDSPPGHRLMRAQPPKKEKGRKTGPRRFDGAAKDVTGLAARIGVTEKALRAQVARGLIPHRRFGGRLIFLTDEVDAFLRQLPGVTVDQALANLSARTGESA